MTTFKQFYDRNIEGDPLKQRGFDVWEDGFWQTKLCFRDGDWKVLLTSEDGWLDSKVVMAIADKIKELQSER